MHKALRLSAVVMLVISLAILGTVSAQAAEVTWKMATKMPPSSPEGKVFQLFADLVKEKSDGKMVIDVFPSEQLGKTQAILEQLQAGLIQVYPEGSAYLQKYVPELKFTNLPFLYTSRDHWVRVMDSPMVKAWLGKVASEHNILALGKISDFVRGPYRVVVCKRPIRKLADVDGMKLRLPPIEMSIETWKHLGANIIVLPWTQVYESLGRGIIEAVNSPIALVESMKFYEQAKFITRHEEYPQGMAFMTNNKAFNDLSPEFKKIVLTAHAEACKESVRIMADVAAKSIERMKKAGVEFITIDRGPFVKKLDTLYKKWDADGKMPKGFLKMVGELADK